MKNANGRGQRVEKRERKGKKAKETRGKRLKEHQKVSLEYKRMKEK